MVKMQQRSERQERGNDAPGQYKFTIQNIFEVQTGNDFRAISAQKFHNIDLRQSLIRPHGGSSII